MVLVLRYFKVRIQKLSILYILSNLIKYVPIIIDNSSTEINKAITTNKLFPEGYILVGISTNIGDTLINLEDSSTFNDDLFRISIGNKNGYIQYIVQECNHKWIGHIAHLIFLKQKLIF